MNDLFLEELNADWRRSEIDTGAMFERLERRKRRLRLVLALEAISGAVALVVGIWCGWRAFTDGNALFGLAAGALLSAVVLSLPAMRRTPIPQLEEGPFGLLQRTRRDLDDLAGIVVRWRLGAWILLVSSAALWLLHLAGRTELRQTAFLSVAWLGTAIAVLIWSGWRRRQIQSERAACERLLAEYRDADA